MAITNGYGTVEQFATRYLGGSVPAATAGEYSQIEEHISAASRLIDDYTGRVFYSATAAEDRYFTAQSAERLYLDDYQSITAVAVDEDLDESYSLTLSATADYRPMPSKRENGWPYTYIEIRRGSVNDFPCWLSEGVKVTAVWGWAAVPDAIREACLLQAFRLYRRQAAPFGVVGGGELGTAVAIPAGKQTGLDPDVEMMVRPFVRLV